MVFLSLIDLAFKEFSKIILKSKEFKLLLQEFIKDSFIKIKEMEWDSLNVSMESLI